MRKNCLLNKNSEVQWITSYVSDTGWRIFFSLLEALILIQLILAIGVILGGSFDLENKFRQDLGKG